MSARLPIGMDATAPLDAGVDTAVATPKLGRAYRARSLAAKIALVADDPGDAGLLLRQRHLDRVYLDDAVLPAAGLQVRRYRAV